MLDILKKDEDLNVIWSPFPGGQERFLSCPVFECLFEGNRGPGKTDALLMDFAQFVGLGWGDAWRGILFRETYKNLQDVITKSQKWFRQIFPGALYNKSEHAWHFETGEILYFSYARTVDDYWAYHGHEYPWIGWEELTNWKTPDLYLMMMSVCRTSDPRVKARRYRATCNPAGRGHNWVKNRFIDQAKPNQIIKDVVKAKDLEEFGITIDKDIVTERCYVHGDRDENKALMSSDPTYMNALLQNNNETQRKAWIAGDWDIVAGGMFDDLWRKDVHVIKPFEIPQSWKIFRAFDYGLSAPFSVGWWAITDDTYSIQNGKKVYYPKKTMIRIHEWYGWEKGKPNKGLRLSSNQLGKGIKEQEQFLKREYNVKRILKGPADASIFGDESDAESIASKISKAYYGYDRKANIFVASNKKPGTRVTRWQLIRDRLESALKKDLEAPHMYSFDTCREGFIRTIRELPRDEDNPDDLDTDAEDHALDETAYMVLHISTKGEIGKYVKHK